MIGFRIGLVAILLSAGERTAHATDLVVELKVHHTRTQFADPVYVEVTITNKGKAVVVGPAIGPLWDNFEFLLMEPETRTAQVVARGGGSANVGEVEYYPNKPSRHYAILFVPPLYSLDQSFWEPFRDGKRVVVSGHYALSDRLSVRSSGVEIFINPRHPDELRHLEKWASEKIEYSKGPNPVNFGIGFRGALSREQSIKVLAPMRESELADLLQLSIRLQELYALDPKFRQKDNDLLVEWLKEQPDIKRQTLVREVSRIASNFKMDSTKDAVEKLLSAP